MSDCKKSEDSSKKRDSKGKKSDKFNEKAVSAGTNISDSDIDPKILQVFKAYSRKLDAKNDKFERIVKLSRDITIESKRIIFLLHTIDRGSNRVSVLAEAEKRLEALISNQWKSIAKELNKEDPYQFRRAYSPGIQEFIEAFTYFNYLKMSRVFHWDYYQSKLQYEMEEERKIQMNDEGESETVEKLEKETEMKKNKFSTTLTQIDFILGIFDVSGELMRKCINNLGAGNTEGTFDACNFVRNLYNGFLSIDVRRYREMSQKMFTLKRNLLKTEMACYTVRIRGKECEKLTMDEIDSTKTYVHDEL